MGTTRIEIKIPYPAGNRTRAAGLEVRDSNRPCYGDGYFEICILKLITLIYLYQLNCNLVVFHLAIMVILLVKVNGVYRL